MAWDRGATQLPGQTWLVSTSLQERLHVQELQLLQVTISTQGLLQEALRLGSHMLLVCSRVSSLRLVHALHHRLVVDHDAG